MKKLILLLAIVGCKQGQGERCQVDDDCSSPLVCNKAKFECQSPGGSQDDDAQLTDAPNVDAFVQDAATIVDAPIDSTVADAPIDASI